MRIRVALVAVVAAGVILRWWALGHQGFWYDEAVTAWLLKGGIARLLVKLPHSESTPPLYYLLAWGWVRAFGLTEAGLRSLSAVAGTAAIPVAFAAARTLAGRRAGLATAALVAVNPLLIWYSQEARSYALLALLTALSLWAYARVRADPTPIRLAAWVAAAVVALATHYFAVFVVAPEVALVLADRRVRLRARLVACTAIGLAAAALVQLALVQRTRHYWFLRQPLPSRAEQVVRHFLVGFTPPAGRVAAVVAAVAVAVAVGGLLRRGGGATRRAALPPAVIGVAAVAVPVLLAVAGVDYLNTRNVIGGLVPLAMVAGIGAAAPRAGRLGAAAIAVVAAVSVQVVVHLHDDPLAQRPGWNRVAAALAPGPPHAIRLEGSHTWARPLKWYLPRTGWLPARGARLREIDVLRRLPTRGDCPRATWWGADCDVAGHPALARPPQLGFVLAGRQRVAGFEIARYRAPQPIWLAADRGLLLER